MKKTLLLSSCLIATFLVTSFVSSDSNLEAATNYDVTIGKQVWMTQNLNVDKFRNGDIIHQVITNEEWKEAWKNKEPAWCYYDNDPTNGTKYGILYNWFAVNDPRGLAPNGYHIPSLEEWNALCLFLGGKNEAGKKMKCEGKFETKVTYVDIGGYYEQKYVPCSNCSYWTKQQKANNPCSVCKNKGGKSVSTGKYIPKTKKKLEEKTQIGGWDGDNSSGFSALPGGYGYYYGYFSGVKEYCEWWSSSEFESNDESNDAYLIGLEKDKNYVLFTPTLKGRGCSVRCIKD